MIVIPEDKTRRGANQEEEGGACKTGGMGGLGLTMDIQIPDNCRALWKYFAAGRWKLWKLLPSRCLKWKSQQRRTVHGQGKEQRDQLE